MELGHGGACRRQSWSAWRAFLVLDPPLTGADSEKVFIGDVDEIPAPGAGRHLHVRHPGRHHEHGVGAVAVASSAFAEDFYKGLFRRDPGRGELLWLGRGAVARIAVLALPAGLESGEQGSWISSHVAWAGFGSAFGPQSCCRCTGIA